MSGSTIAAMAVDGGDLSLGGGLLALVRPALNLLEPGGVLVVLSTSPDVRHDLPRWCQIEHHDYLGCENISADRDQHIIARGSLSVLRGRRETGVTIPHHQGRMTAADMLAAIPLPEHADPSTGFAPRGAEISEPLALSPYE